MGIRKNKQQSGNRKMKRARKRILDEVSTYGTLTVNTLVRTAVPIQGDEASKIIEDYNKKYQLWLRKYCAANGVKLTKPLLDGYEDHILAYIKKVLTEHNNAIKNGEEQNSIQTDAEPSINQTGQSGGED